MNPKIGQYSFLAGVILALVAGLLANIVDASMVTLILVILGLIVGFLNVTAKETTGFLVASIALMIAGAASMNMIPWIGNYVQTTLSYIVVFVAPAAIIVALRAVVASASNE
jgi:lysylphosphatidylglycerol synthetase-like protein (DUF2156 family)